MDKKQKFNSRIAAIAAGSKAMRDLCIESQFDPQTNMYLEEYGPRSAAILEAAKNDPILESMPEDIQVSIVSSMQSAVREYEETYGHLPSDEILASAYHSMGNMLLESAPETGSTAALMLESIGQSINTTEGIETRARMLALVLPVMLDTATNDAVAMIPAGANEAEIFKFYRRAGTDFGNVLQNQELDNSTIGTYSCMRQRVPMANEGNTVKVTIADIRKGSVSIFINRKRVGRDAEITNGIISVNHDSKIITFTINYQTGVIVSSSLGAPATFEAHVEYEVDIENNPERIPTIIHDMESCKIYPFQRAIASDATIQAIFKMNREYGQDLKSMQLSHMRNIISAEKAVGHLLDMDFGCVYESEFNIHTEHEDWRLHREKINEVLLGISQQILAGTKTTGMTGIFAGIGASTILKSLGAPHFIAPPNYLQKNYTHYAGKLFGMWKVFECPSVIGHMDMLCYGRGATHTDAGYIAGDAIPATMYTHPIGKNLKSENTLWELTYGEMNPYDGDKYFHRLRLINTPPASPEAAAEAAGSNNAGANTGATAGANNAGSNKEPAEASKTKAASK